MASGYKGFKQIHQEANRRLKDLKQEEMKTTDNNKVTPSTDATLSLLTGSDWFKEHPEKVLGEPYQTTDRFGKTVTKVKGNLSNVAEGIPVPARADEAQADTLLESEIKEPLEQLLADPEKKKNIERAVNEVKKKKADKALREINGERESASDVCPDGTFCFDDILKNYNKVISEYDIKAWFWYKRTTGGYND